MTRTLIITLTLALLLLIPPTITPTPTVSAQDCVPPLSLTIGEFATMLGGVYVRANPDRNAAIVSYAPERLAVRVIGGPVCADGQNWWQVERIFEEPLFKGWVAEGRPDRQFLFKNTLDDRSNLCPAPLPAPIGQGVLLVNDVRVREVPGRSGRVLTVAQSNTTALVQAGPVCSDGLNWWQVQVDVLNVTYNGWIVEGTPGGPDTEVYDPLVVQPDFDASSAPADLPCGPAAPLGVGDRAIMRFEGAPLKNLRTAPTTLATVIAQIPSGIQMQILSEPFCNEGVNWREVQVFGGSSAPVGWIAEGVWLGRFIGADGDDYGRPAP